MRTARPRPQSSRRRSTFPNRVPQTAPVVKPTALPADDAVMTDDDRRPAPSELPARVTPELVLVEGGLYRGDGGLVPKPDLVRGERRDEGFDDPPPDDAA